MVKAKSADIGTLCFFYKSLRNNNDNLINCCIFVKCGKVYLNEGKIASNLECIFSSRLSTFVLWKVYSHV